jgi:ABC-type nickel/cobalt efflux system permease component RcnA
MMSTGAIIILVIVVVLVLAAGAWFIAQQSRRRRLRERFGPEYDRRIKETDDRRVAERELTDRERRHAKYRLRPLSDTEKARYAEQWTVFQEQFVDQPGESVAAAQQLVHMVMRERGYPSEHAENVEQQAADLSVEHSHVVADYRGAHDVRTRHEQAGASTEELRQALTHLRAVFVSVAGLDEDPPATTTTTTTATTEAPANTASNAPTDELPVRETRSAN